MAVIVELRCPNCDEEFEAFATETVDRHPYGDGHAEERGLDFDSGCPKCGEEGEETGSYEPEYDCDEEYDV